MFRRSRDWIQFLQKAFGRYFIFQVEAAGVSCRVAPRCRRLGVRLPSVRCGVCCRRRSASFLFQNRLRRVCVSRRSTHVAGLSAEMASIYRQNSGPLPLPQQYEATAAALIEMRPDRRGSAPFSRSKSRWWPGVPNSARLPPSLLSSAPRSWAAGFPGPVTDMLPFSLGAERISQQTQPPPLR